MYTFKHLYIYTFIHSYNYTFYTFIYLYLYTFIPLYIYISFYTHACTISLSMPCKLQPIPQHSYSCQHDKSTRIHEHMHIHWQAHHFSSIGFVRSIHIKETWDADNAQYEKNIPRSQLHRTGHRSRWMVHTLSFHFEGPTTWGKMYNLYCKKRMANTPKQARKQAS